MACDDDVLNGDSCPVIICDIGTLITWDYIEMRQINQKTLGREILAMSLAAHESGVLYLALGQKITGDGDEEDAAGSDAEVGDEMSLLFPLNPLAVYDSGHQEPMVVV